MEVQDGEDELDATMIENGYGTGQKKKKYDLKILVKSQLDLPGASK